MKRQNKIKQKTGKQTKPIHGHATHRLLMDIIFRMPFLEIWCNLTLILTSWLTKQCNIFCEVLCSIWSVKKLYQIKKCRNHFCQIYKNFVLGMLLDLCHKFTLVHFHTTKNCITAVTELALHQIRCSYLTVWNSMYGNLLVFLSCTNMHCIHKLHFLLLLLLLSVLRSRNWNT